MRKITLYFTGVYVIRVNLRPIFALGEVDSQFVCKFVMISHLLTRCNPRYVTEKSSTDGQDFSRMDKICLDLETLGIRKRCAADMVIIISVFEHLNETNDA